MRPAADSTSIITGAWPIAFKGWSMSRFLLLLDGSVEAHVALGVGVALELTLCLERERLLRDDAPAGPLPLAGAALQHQHEAVERGFHRGQDLVAVVVLQLAAAAALGARGAIGFLGGGLHA